MQRIISSISRISRASRGKQQMNVARSIVSLSAPCRQVTSVATKIPVYQVAKRSYFHSSAIRFDDAEKKVEEPSAAEAANELPQSIEELTKMLREKEELLKKKEEEAKETHTKYMRSLAEIENVRRIARDDVKKAEEYAIAGFAKNLLEVADSLSMALQSLDPEKITDTEADMLKTMHEGISMVDKIMMDTFQKHGIERYDPKDQEFDPNFHEGMFQYPDPEKTPGTVGQVVKVGYKIKDRVLRPAQVGTVAK